MKKNFNLLTTSLALTAIAGSAFFLTSCDNETKDKVVDTVKQSSQKIKEVVTEQVNSIKDFLGFSTNTESLAKTLQETKEKTVKDILTTVNSNYLDYLAQIADLNNSSDSYKTLKNYQEQTVKYLNSSVEEFSMYKAFATDVYFETIFVRGEDTSTSYPTLEQVGGNYEKFRTKYLETFKNSLLNRIETYKTKHYQNKILSEGYKTTNEAKMAKIVTDYINIVDILTTKDIICKNQATDNAKATCFTKYLSLIGNYPSIINSISYLEAKDNNLTEQVTPEFQELAIDDIVKFQNDYVKNVDLNKVEDKK